MAAGNQPGVYQPMATWLQPAGRQQILPQQVISTAYPQGNPQGYTQYLQTNGLQAAVYQSAPDTLSTPVESEEVIQLRIQANIYAIMEIQKTAMLNSKESPSWSHPQTRSRAGPRTSRAATAPMSGASPTASSGCPAAWAAGTAPARSGA